MRKWHWVGIGVLSALTVVGSGGWTYWFFGKTTVWVAKGVQAVHVVCLRNGAENGNGGNGGNEGNAEVSDVVEPLVVQKIDSVPAPETTDQPVSEPARVKLEPGMQQPPRPEVESGEIPRMPMADEEVGVGAWFFAHWTSVKAALGQLDAVKCPENVDPSTEPESKQADPAAEMPMPEPPVTTPAMPDYHHDYPHCPYQGPCPYRGQP